MKQHSGAVRFLLPYDKSPSPESLETMWVAAFLNGNMNQPKKRRRKRQVLKLAVLKPYWDELQGSKKPAPQIKKPLKNFSMISADLDSIYKSQKERNKAATRIQKFWLFLKLIRMIYWTCYAVGKVVRIQRVARKYISRKILPLMHENRRVAATIIQASYRRFISNREWCKQRILENVMASKLQRAVRGHWERLTLMASLRNSCAVRIQAVWRGRLWRPRYARLRLEYYSIRIQAVFRKWSATKAVCRRRNVFNSAAETIQAAFRTWRSHNLLSAHLIERETDYRACSVFRLLAEERYLNEALTKAATRFVRGCSREKLHEMLDDQRARSKDVQAKTNDLSELHQQLAMLSPVAVQQGWASALSKSIEATRQSILCAKEEFLFQQVRRTLQIEEDVNRQGSVILEHVEAVSRVKQWKDQEKEERLQWAFRRSSELSKRKQRCAVGDERRRWQVRHYCSDGKPNLRYPAGVSKNSKPCQPFLKEMNIVNLFTALKENLKQTTIESKCASSHPENNLIAQYDQRMRNINQTIDDNRLQTFENQADLFSEIIKPITSILSHAMKLDVRPDSSIKITTVDLSMAGTNGDFAESLRDIQVVAGRSPHVRPLSNHKARFPTVALRNLSSSNYSRASSSSNSTNLGLIASLQSRSGPAAPAVYSNTTSTGNSMSTKTIPRPSDKMRERDGGRGGRKNSRGSNSAPMEDKILTRRRRTVRVGGSVPWHLLDELDHEKQRFAKERSVIETNLGKTFY